jgi:phosphoribosyl-ATP pyrophosphohydrolase
MIDRIVNEITSMIESKRDSDNSYVSSLLASGPRQISKKIVEESGEVAIASLVETDEKLISELADLSFHILVLCSSRNIAFAQIMIELERRLSITKSSPGQSYNRTITGI